MTKKAASPFAGLDTSLLRATQATSDAQSQEDAEGPSPVRPRRGRGVLQARGTTQPNDREPLDVVGRVERSIKVIGKEIYYIRVTPTEKQRVDDLVHAFKQRGIRTSVNEVGRIALNGLLEDYDQRGEESVLAQVLVKRHA